MPLPFLIIGAVEVVEAAPAIAAAAAEAVPVVEAGIASVEAALTGSSAATAVATTSAATTAAAAGTEAAATAAGATAAEATASAAAHRAAGSAASHTAEHIAEYLKTPEGNKLLMENVKAHLESMTTEASAKTGLMEKLGGMDWAKGLATAAKYHAVGHAIGGAVAAAASLTGVYELYEHMHGSVSNEAHSSLHGAAAIGGHTNDAIQRLADTGANYGVATCLGHDMKEILTQVSADNRGLQNNVNDLVIGLNGAMGVNGMEGAKALVESTSAKTVPLVDLSKLETQFATGSGHLSAEQLSDAKEKLKDASLILDGAPQQKVNDTLTKFEKLGPTADLKTTQDALTSLNAAREAIQQDVYNGSEQVIHRLQQIAKDRADDLQSIVNELKPQIAHANAQHLEKQAAHARDSKECAPVPHAASQPELSR